MYNETQLAALKLFGNKTLSFGCLFKYPNQWDDDILTVCSLYDDTGNSKTLSFLPPDKESTWEINYFTEDTEIEILGHEPHLFPDVARVAESRGWLLEIKWGMLTVTFPDRIYTSTKYDTLSSFLDQPNLSEIVNLFSK